MTMYKIYEKQSINVIKEPSIVKDFSTLTAAKKYASKIQTAYDTVMIIDDDIHTVAYKDITGWR